MLYKRDYRVLTPEEEKQLQKAEAYRIKSLTPDGGLSVKALISYHNLRPAASYYYQSLFPNNHLFIGELDDPSRLDVICQQFAELLNRDGSERAVLNFINDNEYYPLIGSLLKSSYDFGHHDAYAFKEFELPPNFIADYLLVGKNSGGYEFVFVELESPTGAITNADGTFGTTIRKGLKQIEDWDAWIDSNFSHLRLLFQKYMSTRQAALPNEFISLDKTRIHYALVAGRRKDYKTKTYRLRRKLKREHNITLLHYDNVINTLQTFKQSANY